MGFVGPLGLGVSVVRWSEIKGKYQGSGNQGSVVGIRLLWKEIRELKSKVYDKGP